MTSIETEGDPQYWLAKDVIKPERKRAKNVVAIDGERGGRQYRSLTEPLEFYIARSYITESQYSAGTRLHALWKGSILHARYARMNYGDIGGVYDPESMALMPRDYFDAMDAVGGFPAKRIVRQVCCFGEPLGNRKEMLDLKSGLDDLARFFRY